MTPVTLSVIVPSLNEREHLPELLADLALQKEIQLRILIADGGSTDGTLDKLPKGVEAVHSGAGRARQMNAGAARTTTEWLLFLHADSRLQNQQLLIDAVRRVAAESRSTGPVAGHFAVEFAPPDPDHQAQLNHMQEKSRLNRRYTINGDQGLLVRREDFYELG